MADIQAESLSAKVPNGETQVPLAVIVVDDSDMFRRITVNFLKDCPEVQVVGEASSFGEAIKMIAELTPDVTIMDVHMPDHKNLTAEEIRKGCEKSRVLAISIYDDEETAELAAKFGAYAFLEKGNLSTKLIPVLHEIGKVSAN
jgi:DNA-binding NarL/FixJ family response regulator